MPTYEYPRPGLTVDAVVFRNAGERRQVLLIERGKEPFLGMWALPGGFVDEFEPLEDAVRRELAEETAVRLEGPMSVAGAFGDPGRDPRGWTVTVAYVAIAPEGVEPRAGDDAAGARWWPIDALPQLASDHAAIIAAALAQADLLGW